MSKDDIEQIFSCTMCGFCCHGETTVSLNAADQKRMIDTLGLPVEQVREKYWRITGSVVQMQVVDGHCIFYDNGCTVHKGRPWRCRQWPLHPSILEDESNFETIKESCPGINRTVSYSDFCRILQKLIDNDVLGVQELNES